MAQARVDAGTPPEAGEIITVLYVHCLLADGRPDQVWQVGRRAGIVFPPTVPHRAAAMADHIVGCWSRPRVRERVVSWLNEKLQGPLHATRVEGYAYLEDLWQHHVAPECLAYLGYRARLPGWLDWVRGHLQGAAAERFQERWEAVRRRLQDCGGSSPGPPPPAAAAPHRPDATAELCHLRQQVRDLKGRVRRAQQREQRLLARLERERGRARREVQRIGQALADVRGRLRADRQAAAAMTAERERLALERERQLRAQNEARKRRVLELEARVQVLTQALVELCAWPHADRPPLARHRVLVLGAPARLPALQALVLGLGGECRHLPLAGQFRQALEELQWADLALVADAIPERSAAQLARAANRAGTVLLRPAQIHLSAVRDLLLHQGVPRLHRRPRHEGGSCMPAPGRETATERRLRLALQEAGIAFEQEAPIAGLRVDFLLPAGQLVVEVDGLIHALAHKARIDRRRDAILGRRGYRVMRIPAEDLRRAAGVRHWVQAIRVALAAADTAGPRDIWRSAAAAHMPPG